MNNPGLKLFKLLEQAGLVDKICSYAGWNTNCNSLGTTLGGLVFNHSHEHGGRYNLRYRYVEDVFYQSDVRQEVLTDYLPEIGGSYFDLNGQDELVCKKIEQLLNQKIHEHDFLKDVSATNVVLPWRRMFELNFDLISSGQ